MIVNRCYFEVFQRYDENKIVFFDDWDCFDDDDLLFDGFVKIVKKDLDNNKIIFEVEGDGLYELVNCLYEDGNRQVIMKSIN